MPSAESGDKPVLAKSPVSIPDVDSISEFRMRAQELFVRIDLDQDGFVSRKEISKAVENPSYKGEDAQVIAGLFDSKTWSRLVESSDDQRGKDNSISPKDIQQLDQERASKIEFASKFMPYAEKNFAKLDKDGNGFLEIGEIEIAQSNKKLSAPDRNALKQLRAAYARLQQESNDEWFWENDGITRKDLKVFANQIDGLKQDQAAADNAMKIADRTYRGIRDQSSTELFGGMKPKDAITPEAIKQGRIADCYFLATLASVARNNPELIRDMIRANRNGTFTVAFPGDKAHPVTVAAPTETELGVGNRGTKFGVWARVLESAFARWRLERGNSKYPNATIELEGAHGPDTGKFALRVLTNSDADERGISSLSNEQLVSTLDSVMNSNRQKRMMMASVPGGSDGEKTKDGFVKQHLYSVLAFERTAKDRGFVTVRNPWGAGTNTPEGTTRINLETFRRNFNIMTVQK